MKNYIQPHEDSDPAAILGCALSLHEAAEAHPHCKLNLSECYNGCDEFMREVMRVATLFENWACVHVDFDHLNDVWPYMLEDKFGQAVIKWMSNPYLLAEFKEADCAAIAVQHLNLKLK